MKEQTKKILTTEIFKAPSEDFEKTVFQSVSRRLLEKKMRKTKRAFIFSTILFCLLSFSSIHLLKDYLQINSWIEIFAPVVFSFLLLYLLQECFYLYRVSKAKRSYGISTSEK